MPRFDLECESWDDNDGPNLFQQNHSVLKLDASMAVRYDPRNLAGVKT